MRIVTVHRRFRYLLAGAVQLDERVHEGKEGSFENSL